MGFIGKSGSVGGRWDKTKEFLLVGGVFSLTQKEARDSRNQPDIFQRAIEGEDRAEGEAEKRIPVSKTTFTITLNI